MLSAGLCEGVEKALDGNGRLVGSWETTVGELDSFFHIWEYEGYGGYDKAQPTIRESKVRHFPPLFRTSSLKTTFAHRNL